MQVKKKNDGFRGVFATCKTIFNPNFKWLNANYIEIM